MIHQVPTRTVFTVIERGETKSLFAEVLETSLEVVNVDKLQSTEISSKQVYYSDVDTKYPRSGVTVSPNTIYFNNLFILQWIRN